LEFYVSKNAALNKDKKCLLKIKLKLTGGNTMIENEILKNIKSRRSVRSFKDEQIKGDELQAILEAGMHLAL
jgi:hypothetical protein